MLEKKYKKSLKQTLPIFIFYIIFITLWIFIDIYNSGFVNYLSLIGFTLVSINLSIITFEYHNKIIAEIKGGKLYLFSGIGLYDPSRIELKSITKTKRISKKLLVINYNNNTISLEADKIILNDLEKDLNKIILKN